MICLTSEIGNERATGIEPAWPAWKAGTLPLSYARTKTNCRDVVALPSAFSLARSRLLFHRSMSSYWIMKLAAFNFLFSIVSLVAARADLTIVQKVEGLHESGQ